MSKQQIDEAELAIYGRLDTLSEEDRDEVLGRICITYKEYYAKKSKERLDNCLNSINFDDFWGDVSFDSIEDIKKHSIIPVQDLQGPTFPLNILKCEVQDEEWFNNLPVGS